ncbi:unnamed protein product [Clavelina lepadiformis]|uniref:Uncharacterized protein n=1 Tax=Clavelina lepadiformis TaxID=159417 RepID=A0ABP0GYX8_CLALP
MSVHSIDHTDSEVTNRSYKGYHIDTEGKVTEFYDHRDDEGAASSVAMSQPSRPLVNTNGNVSNVATSRSPAQRKVRYRNAGCCDSCVSLLVTIGTMPFATAFALLCSWAGTAMFVGAGWAALDETLDLFAKYGPNSGNPATDPAPQYIYAPGSFSGEFILRDDNDLGNRVPEVFQAIKYSFYAIIPFMLIFTIVVACDNRRSSRAVVSKQRSCKTSSSGICCTSGLIFCTYVLILAWVFWLAFTTLGVYYYRISMLRCSDLKYRAYPEGVWRSICIDLVQLGVIMFQNTNDNGFGKICGPGENTRGYGKLDEYCENYFVVYQYMLVCFSGILLNIIAMVRKEIHNLVCIA